MFIDIEIHISAYIFFPLRNCQPAILGILGQVVIDFIETDFQPLKNALVDHCQKWQKKLTDLLNENARTEMNLGLKAESCLIHANPLT